MIKEHYRFGSTRAILSRSFCNTDIITDLEEVAQVFKQGMYDIRTLEEEILRYQNYFEDNRKFVFETVRKLSEE